MKNINMLSEMQSKTEKLSIQDIGWILCMCELSVEYLEE